jgi:hypothetical protein
MAVLVALATLACVRGQVDPVVDNRTSEPVYIRVGGVVDDAAKARVIVVPPQTRTSLTEVRGLPTMFLTDVTMLAAADCRELAQWSIDDELFTGAIVVRAGGSVEHRPDDSGSEGSPADESDQCPPGPDVLP